MPAGDAPGRRPDPGWSQHGFHAGAARGVGHRDPAHLERVCRVDGHRTPPVHLLFTKVHDSTECQAMRPWVSAPPGVAHVVDGSRAPPAHVRSRPHLLVAQARMPDLTRYRVRTCASAIAAGSVPCPPTRASWSTSWRAPGSAGRGAPRGRGRRGLPRRDLEALVRRRHTELRRAACATPRSSPGSPASSSAGGRPPRRCRAPAAAHRPRLNHHRATPITRPPDRPVPRRTTMCGIVGYIGTQQAAPLILEGLSRLEHRGYDSAGVAVLGGSRSRRCGWPRRPGACATWTSELPKRFGGKVGIGHTRWATHGPATDVNAHPHTDGAGEVAVVHNGIIDNAAALRSAADRRRRRPGLRHRHRGARPPHRPLATAETLEQRVAERALGRRGHLRPGRRARRLPGPDRGRPQRQPAPHRGRREGDARRLRPRRADPPHHPGRPPRGRRDRHPHRAAASPPTART